MDDGSHVYAYDANNMIDSVDGGTVQYKYNANSQRVMKVAASETTYYVFGAEYSSVAGWRRIFVTVGGIKVEYRDNQTYFHQSDHLGTPRVQTDSSGNLVETWSYYPFGEQWQQTGSGGNEHRFTGHRRDPETGNDYAGNRFLRSSRSRWLSVDPALGGLGNPQRLNRYSYVLNNPIRYLDPDGRDPKEGPINIGSGGGTTVIGELPPSIETAPSEIRGLLNGEGVEAPEQNQETGAQGTVSVGPPNTSEKADFAIDIALGRLESESCRALLGKNAATTLMRLRDENRIRYSPGPYYMLNSDGALTGGWVAMVPPSATDRIFLNTRGPFDNPSNTFVWDAGHRVVTHDFLRDWKDEFGKDLTAEDMREGIILHELGHVLGVFGPDAEGTGDQWQLENSVNQHLIQDHCFNGVDVGEEEEEGNEG